MKKQKEILMLSGLFAGLLLTSCGEGGKKNGVEDASMPMQNEMHMEGESEDMTDEVAQEELNFNNEEVAEVYEHYTHVKTALVASNAAEAQSGARMMVTSLEKHKGQQQALEAAKKIAQTEDINQQRAAFATLAEPMTAIVKGTVSSGEIYKQHCPMAFEGKGGYWLASTSEIRNPFFGEKMLKCGSVRETIK